MTRRTTGHVWLPLFGPAFVPILAPVDVAAGDRRETALETPQ